MSLAAAVAPRGEPPEPGAAVEIAEGVLWARVPLPMAGLDHANLYALDDRFALGGWTLVDTGLDWPAGRAALDALLSGPLAGHPVVRVILTHHHPDHAGQLGRIAGTGVEIRASRTAWLYARMLTLDVQDRPVPEQLLFRRRAGQDDAALAAYAEARPFNFADCVAPIPLGLHAIGEGDRLEAGGRRWTVRLGQGHAPDHATLWSEDGALVIAGDQMLPGISPNIGVYPTEPDADPLGAWLESCERFRRIAEAEGMAAEARLVLPGHQRPFTGIAGRMAALIEGHEQALSRIERALAGGPLTALEMFHPIYRRSIRPSEIGLALAEAVAHANRLYHAGRAVRRLSEDGAWLYDLPS